ncbi:MAG: hypothetical protein CUN55_01920 [Phototrophicales bacterium]|nr:MAG: hypothetical protein CUN55_01920 [Phototrophicales bacterium]
MDDENMRPDWLEEFEDLANRELAEGSACEQIHPMIEAWYTELMNDEPPPSRDSVLQAIACLSTEVLTDMPEVLLSTLELNDESQEALILWVQEILMIGRAFQIALDKGRLDDL